MIPKSLTLRPRVLITFFPERLTAQICAQDRAALRQDQKEMSPEASGRVLRHLGGGRGLRAQLETGNLLTGELYVAFDTVPNAPKPKIDWSRSRSSCPSPRVAGEPRGETQQHPGEGQSTCRLAEMGVGVKNVLGTLNQTLKQADTLISRVDTELVPEGTKTLEELHQTIADADKTLLGNDSADRQDLHDACRNWRCGALGARLHQLSAAAP